MLIVDTPLSTERLVLRPFRTADLDDLHAIQSRPDVVRYLPWGVRRRDQVQEVLRERLTTNRWAKDDDSLAAAVQRQGASRVIGYVQLWLRSAEHRQGEVGFVFHPDAQGRGYAAEAAAAVLDLAFTELGLHRVYGRTDARNEASAALMRRLGMRQEAHLRHSEMLQGEWRDELIFAVLGDEWRPT